ncbi:M20/M25/M40 family metallo-hydrolase [Clostridium magnum]|uniref:Succinyl-diaminopimelate desuccinylase n=1 Tax=Clostridium magnum DSM 2767 TaxID=1121326 RepID=A0A161X7X0_9CLOT|nr:M20/M25/M40 family metallo-hydrolase [Clostridium magnum]KZL90246.1 succinyl-diaminopimelate desuccinylase [Clostridium magnum DSM 2767]SHI13855.1 Acetylornithine deacetylase/Succinyl-diaminopimelate desuccinylase [Clostridium magnum DSM 2767]
MTIIDDFISENFHFFRKSLEELIASKGISSTGEGIKDTIDYVQSLFSSLLNAETKILKTNGNPAIYASIPGESPFTVLFYGHYDVMSPEPVDKWNSDPFKLTEKDGKFYARGIGDNKGQLIAQILGVYSYLKLNEKLPFNVKFLIEGEEEQGSVHLPDVVKKYGDTLLQADLVVVVDGSMHESGRPVLRLGNRGLVSFEIKVKTADFDSHSGNAGNVVENPIMVLNKIINKLYSSDKNCVNIPYFYDGVLKPTELHKKWIEAIPYNQSSVEKRFGVSNINLNKEEYYDLLMFKPTFNISGIYSGYSGEGIKNIIPNEAIAKFDIRLVGKQDSALIMSNIKKVVEEFSPFATIKEFSSYPPSMTNSDLPYIETAIKALEAASDEKIIVEPVMAGTVPNYVWTDILKKPTLTIPYANADQNNHAPNENMDKLKFIRGIKSSYYLIKEFGD